MCGKLFQEHPAIEEAYQLACRAVENLYLDKVDLGQLVITKGLSREVEEYASAQCHSELVKKMRQRDPGSAPRVGDRVPYVMIHSQTGGVVDMAEDPLYVLEHSIPINVEYYVNSQLRKPLTRFLTPVVGSKRVSSIFEGQHTRKRMRTLPPPPSSLSSSTPLAGQRGSILGFITRTPHCQRCKTGSLEGSGHPALCKACVDGGAAPELAREKRAEHEEAKQQYEQVLAYCQRCQGSARDPVLCMAKDCPILYKRKSWQARSERSTAELQRMGLLEW